MKFEWYREFVRLGEEPDWSSELVASYRFRPAPGFSVREAAGRIASESSVGTWTTLYSLPESARKLMARVYRIESGRDGSYLALIAYPSELFEPGNMPALIASVAGNVYGMRAVQALRLEDVYLPPSLLGSFKGPWKGIGGVREAYRVAGRPIVGTVPKPKVGYDPAWIKEVAYEILAGGMDYVKDDENLASQSFCKFEDRARAIMAAIEKAERETGERKVWFANVTASVSEIERRARLVADHGNPVIMLDVVVAGWSTVQHVRELAEDLDIAIHAHRAFHAAFTRSREHGMSMFVLAKLLRLVGVDQLHIGTPEVGKLEAKKKDVVYNARILRDEVFSPDPGDSAHFGQEWHGIKPAFPVSSGGLHPGTIPEVVKHLGVDVVIQVGGGVMGHPDGPRAGAAAVRQAIEASLSGVELEEYARTHPELRRALEKWGRVAPA